MTTFTDGSLAAGLIRCECEVWLRVQVGAAKGRAIAIYGPQIRDRPRSKLPLAARLGHGQQASFGDRAARRTDLPSRPWKHQRHRSRRSHICETPRSRSTTAIASRSARSSARWSSGSDKAEAGPVEKMIAGWLQGEGSVSQPYHGESQQTISFPTTDDARPPKPSPKSDQARGHPGRSSDHSPAHRARRPRMPSKSSALSLPRSLRTAHAAPGCLEPRIRAPFERASNWRAAGPPSSSRPSRRRLATLPDTRTRHGRFASSPPHHPRRMPPHARRSRPGRVARFAVMR